MTVELLIHLEPAGAEVIWWAESPDFAGFSAAAASLSELRARATQAITEFAGPNTAIVERMADSDAGDEDHDGLVVKAQLVPA